VVSLSKISENLNKVAGAQTPLLKIQNEIHYFSELSTVDRAKKTRKCILKHQAKTLGNQPLYPTIFLCRLTRLSSSLNELDLNLFYLTDQTGSGQVTTLINGAFQTTSRKNTGLHTNFHFLNFYLVN